MGDASLQKQLELVTAGLDPIIRKTSLLKAIAWPDEVEKQFFANAAKVLPDVTYQVDHHQVDERMAALEALLQRIDGKGDVQDFLRRTVQSFIDGNRLLQSLGSKRFYEISREVYGSASSDVFASTSTNLQLADHIEQRLAYRCSDEALDEVEPRLSAEAFAEALRNQLSLHMPTLEVEVLVDERCTAKVQAGMSRVRVRADAVFKPSDVANLWSHEIETHALSANNGAAQQYAGFLRAGGPRSTRTQEGLATFAELYDHSLQSDRMSELALRVRIVDRAERGANFLELYQFLLSSGLTPRQSYLDAQRVCRGGLVTGGAPFTKDVCYLSGLLEVYTFLSVMVRGGHRDEAELIVCGRVTLDDMAALTELRHIGLLSRPKFLPRWLRNWRGLIPYFALISFTHVVSLPELENRFRRLFDLAKT